MALWLTISYLIIVGFMSALWFLAEKFQRGDLVDLGWITSLLFLAGIAAITQPGDLWLRAIFFLLVCIWAGRLLVGLLNRLFNSRQEDGRYASLRSSWGAKAKIRFFILFQVEALLALILSWPFFLITAQSKSVWQFSTFLGMALLILGLVGETLADAQLKSYKAAPEPDRVCKKGLWRYSRHPNYFFEWVVWMGIGIMALPHSWGWTGLVSPALMYISLRWVTGVPPAERQTMLSRGEAYRAYQQTTSPFFPLPPRKKGPRAP